MADERRKRPVEASARDGLDLKPERFVRSLIPDPRNIPTMQVFSGFLGESPDMHHIRLYRNAALSTFFEIPRDDILHVERLDDASDRIPSSILWVRADAAVEVVRIQSASAPNAGLARQQVRTRLRSR
jgi:hypothetical protein